MDIKEFYKQVDGDYEGTLSRLLKEERILKYLQRLSTSGDYEGMLKGIEESNQETAFRFSHNLKGVSLNLGLSKLADSSSRLCDEYRNGIPDHDVSELLQEVQEDYAKAIDLISQIEQTEV